jgi:peptidyl-prolyl cis-trans isomerase D
VSGEIFALKDGEVSAPLRVGRGYAIAALAGRQDPSIPKLDEVKDKVRNDVLKEKSSRLAADKAASIGASLKSAADFAAAAKKAGLEAKTSELVARGTALPDVGLNATVEKIVFGLPAGATSDPITTLDGTTILKVLQRQDVTPAEMAASRESVRRDLMDESRSQFFTAYMVKARQRMKIDMNRDVLARILG